MSSDGGDADPPGSWEWAVCGASVTGSEHQRHGLGCDDAYAYGVAGDFIVAAVADGAGSVTGTSAWGSYTACQSVLADATKSRFIHQYQSMPAEERESLIRWLFDRAVQRVTDQADAFGLDASRLSTTLCVALADREVAVFGQIGDGIIATESDGQITTLLIEAKDEYANATWFLQSEAAFDVAFRTATRPAPSAFALSTDGMSYKITNVATGEAYEPFFRGSWDHVRSGVSSANFTALLRGIEDDQTGDDKTTVLAALRWEDDEFYPSGRPVRKTLVSSPAPPLLATSALATPLLEIANPAPQQDSSLAQVDADNADQIPAVPAPEEQAADDAAESPPAESVTDPLPVTGTAKRRHRFGRRRQR